MPDNSRPGETPGNPLPPNTPAAPYYVRTPIQIEIVNASAAELAAWVAGERPQRDAHGDALITVSLPAGRAGGAETPPAKAAGNTLHGSGTKEDPYTTAGVLYATAPVSFAFAGITPAMLGLEAKGEWLFALHNTPDAITAIPDDPTEYSDGGSRIYRYNAAPERGAGLPSVDEEALANIEAHLRAYIPGERFVLHEVGSDKVRLDIHIYSPAPERNFYTLVTVGMSHRAMNVPREFPECRYTELMICLPADWPLGDDDLKNDTNNWPLRWLRLLAYFPHDFNTWLWTGHTLPNGDPARQLSPTVRFTGMAIAPPITLPAGFGTVPVRDGKTVRIQAVLPVYDNELEYKLAKGADALFDLFDRNNVSELLDPNRPSVIPRKRFLGLF
ncbi:MAG TPA: suppressor of fused domain protein [Candidatus Kapabacteria bacterium]|nr:suppressor of fused domain protein [Candidatus Kapabacteria bacterium]